MNNFLAIIIAPVLTFFGIWLTNSHNIKVMKEQNNLQKDIVREEHKNSMEKLEKEKYFEGKLEEENRIRKINEERLTNIYYPIIKIYDMQDKEEEKTDNYQDGLNKTQCVEIWQIINNDANKILLGSNSIKAFHEAESELIYAEKNLNPSDPNLQYYESGFDSSGDFRRLIQSKIIESEKLLDIY
ncbi:hypothetical protein RAK27_05330 [Carnobacterium maltaromaticum]|uniref:Uncharacterized protein n=1 Tax=Carnobacterium maltaromaticum TaxID=2751 RepID=A0AAW9JN88_CARML|nr:hypothetical protein [Carnobacterium maltaromaticum]MDZ5758075.1 hypothetical protein [Carnobacterium maltaromaticum]